jgi:hypothetical protein
VPEDADAIVVGAGAWGPGTRRTRPRATAHTSITSPPKDYEGIRLGPRKYIEWPTAEKELYDETSDPHELHNRVQEPNLLPIREFLRRQLRRLENCVGRDCSEVTPPIPLTASRGAARSTSRSTTSITTDGRLFEALDTPPIEGYLPRNVRS